LEAVAHNDQLKIRELQIRYSTRRTDRRTSPSQRPKSPSGADFDPETPGPGPSEFEDTKKGQTPYANREGDNEEFLKKERKKKAAKPTPLDGLTVQTYLEKYTSEDNASFEELFELHHQRERVRIRAGKCLK
jgi:hypothetical protein